MPSTLDSRLRGSLRGQVVREFFANSAHFPLANIFLEFLLEGSHYLSAPDFYAILSASLAQAYVLARADSAGRPRPFLGNLIGPAIYSSTEVLIDGLVFFSGPQHLAYWGFSISIEVLQQLRRVAPRAAEGLLLAEHVVRTCILFVMYWIFEGLTKPEYGPLSGFLADPSHVYVAIVIPTLGFVIGLANVGAARYLAVLQATAADLKIYSEWFLGAELLSRAIAQPTTLALQRRNRSVLFMDIRGFTSWSEQHSPEAVVAMLNAYFEAAEEVWLTADAIKAKLTGDEVMAVFPNASAALHCALALREQVAPVLQPLGLRAGIGVHSGPLVEGLIGSKHLKGYDVLGDSVNTAKRICDVAAGDEVLISQATFDELEGVTDVGPERQVEVKGKAQALTVYPVLDDGAAREAKSLSGSSDAFVSH